MIMFKPVFVDENGLELPSQEIELKDLAALKAQVKGFNSQNIKGILSAHPEKISLSKITIKMPLSSLTPENPFTGMQETENFQILDIPGVNDVVHCAKI